MAALPATDPPITATVATETEALRARPIRTSQPVLELWLPMGVLVAIGLACFVWPLVYRVPNPLAGTITNSNLPPLSAHHLFGTDPTGNDVLSRLLYGGRDSLEVGFASTSLGLVVGGALGMFAGYRGGMVEAVIMRILDVLIAFPGLILLIVISEYLGPSLLHVIWAISFFSIPAFARLARAVTLRSRQQTYVLAARLCGTRELRTILRHVALDVVPSLMTYSFLAVSVAVLIEAALSFLGYGVPPPAPSWGNMIAAGQEYLNSDPYLVLIPSALLFVTVICLNLVGDALRARWSTG